MKLGRQTSTAGVKDAENGAGQSEIWVVCSVEEEAAHLRELGIRSSSSKDWKAVGGESKRVKRRACLTQRGTAGSTDSKRTVRHPARCLLLQITKIRTVVSRECGLEEGATAREGSFAKSVQGEEYAPTAEALMGQ